MSASAHPTRVEKFNTSGFHRVLDPKFKIFSRIFSTTIISLSRIKIIKQIPVPERPISVNPGLTFCSVFVFYIPMHCLGEHFLLLLKRLNSIL